MRLFDHPGPRRSGARFGPRPGRARSARAVLGGGVGALARGFSRVGGRCLARLLCAALVAAPLWAAQSRDVWAQSSESCLGPDERARALQIALVSNAPQELCAPSFQIVELRNASAAPLGDLRLFFSPPLEPGQFTLASERFEISTDDGATWRPIGAPLGAGSEEDPYVWSSAEAAPLATLGAAGRSDDSVLLRWRAAYGEAFGDPFGPEARLWFSAEGRDACGVRAVTPLQGVILPLQRPELRAELTGRNVSRGGAFGAEVRAAPGDEIEWRVAIENAGAGIARQIRLRLSDGAQPLRDLAGGGALGQVIEGVRGLDDLAEGARRTVTLRERAGPGCERRPTVVEPSWGCQTAPLGDLSSLRGPLLSEGVARGVLDMAPDPGLVGVAQDITGVDGRTELGDLAQVRITLTNEGAPIQRPVAVSTLPSGFVFDGGAPVEISARGADVARVEVDARRGDAPRLTLLGADGAPAWIDPGGQVQLQFRVRRAAPSGEDGPRVAAASATLAFESACGDPGRAAAERAEVPLRVVSLAADIEPVGEAIVAGAGEQKRFRVRVANTGDEIARDLRLRARLGPGWVANAPEGCRVDRDAPRRPGRSGEFLCGLDRTLPPGAATSIELPLVVADSALTGAALSLDVVAEARGRRSDGETTEDTVARAEASGAAVGFLLRQRLLNLSDPNAPERAATLDLGERATIEVEARWFGLGPRALSDVAITQTLPPTLGFLRARKIAGDAELLATLTPAERGSGQVLWSLATVRGAGEFIGRVETEAVASAEDPDPTAADIGGPETRGLVEADGLFSFLDASYGVDLLDAAATRADPIAFSFQRPSFRLSLEFEDRAPDGDGAFALRAGELLEGAVRLQNIGSADGFLDWVTFEPPAFAAVEPFDGDGLDNDGDGVVDEPDEGAATQEADGEGRARLRWVTPPRAPAVAAAAQRVAVGADLRWPIVLRVSADVAPGAEEAMLLEGQFGPQPFAVERAAARSRVSSRALARTPALRAFMALTGTSVGEDLNASVRHGERTDHRLSLRFPPGRVEGAIIESTLPDALWDVAAGDARLGPGLECPDVGDPQVERDPTAADPTARRRLVWRLGDCVGRLDVEDGARTAILDFTGRVEDADPLASAAARDAWRRVELASRVSWTGPNGGSRAPIGQSGLTLSGPVLRVTEVIDDAPETIGGADAGDPLETRILIENVGDAPSRNLAVTVQAGGGPGAGGGFDCAALRVAFVTGSLQGGAELDRVARRRVSVDPAPPCGARLAAPDLTMPPGGSVAFTISGQAAAALRRGGPLRASIDVRADADDEASAAKTNRAALHRPAASTAAPTLSIANRGAETPAAPIGRAFRLRTAARLGEGEGRAALGLRFRLVNAAGQPVPSDASAVALIGSALSAPAGAALGEPSVSEEAGQTGPSNMLIRRDPDGWRRFETYLGAVRVPAGPEPADAEVALEATAVLLDTPAVSEGRILEVAPVLALGSEAASVEEGAAAAASRRLRQERGFLASPASSSVGGADGSTALLRRVGDAQALTRVAEPYLEIAATHGDPDGAAAAGDVVEFQAIICNRGSGAAFALRVSGRLPVGFRPDPGAPPRFERADAETAFAPPRFGAAEATGRVIEGMAASGAALAPGRCVLLRADGIATDEISGGDGTAVFRIVSYAGRASAAQPGRVYRGGADGAAGRIAPQDVAIRAAEDVILEEDGFAVLPFALRPSGEAPLRVRLMLEGGDTAWAAHLDRNADGLLDAEDPLWRDGDALAPGRWTRFVARGAPRDRSAPPPTRDVVSLRLLSLRPDGRVGRAAREIVARRGDVPAGRMRAERRMAIDSDCDGALTDESTRNAVFAPTKEAAPGECVIMRIDFANEGASALEQVTVEDILPAGLRFAPRSGRFVSTPRGLIGAAVREPVEPTADRAGAPNAASEGAGALTEASSPRSASGRRIRFEFVGALGPGLSGAVEYRLRVL